MPLPSRIYPHHRYAQQPFQPSVTIQVGHALPIQSELLHKNFFHCPRLFSSHHRYSRKENTYLLYVDTYPDQMTLSISLFLFLQPLLFQVYPFCRQEQEHSRLYRLGAESYEMCRHLQLH